MSLIEAARKALKTGLSLGDSTSAGQGMRALESLVRGMTGKGEINPEMITTLMRSDPERVLRKATKPEFAELYKIVNANNTADGDELLMRFPNKFSSRTIKRRLAEIQSQDPDMAAQLEPLLLDGNKPRTTSVFDENMAPMDRTVPEEAGTSFGLVDALDGGEAPTQQVFTGIDAKGELDPRGTSMSDALKEAGVESQRVTTTPAKRPRVKGETFEGKAARYPDTRTGSERIAEVGKDTPQTNRAENWVVAMMRRRMTTKDKKIDGQLKSAFNRLAREFAAEKGLDEVATAKVLKKAESNTNSDDMPLREEFIGWAKQLPEDKLRRSTKTMRQYVGTRDKGAANLEKGGERQEQDMFNSSVTAAGGNPTTAGGTGMLFQNFDELSQEDVDFLNSMLTSQGLSARRKTRLPTDPKGNDAADRLLQNLYGRPQAMEHRRILSSETEEGNRLAFRLAEDMARVMFNGADYTSDLSMKSAIEGIARNLRGQYGLDFNLDAALSSNGNMTGTASRFYNDLDNKNFPQVEGNGLKKNEINPVGDTGNMDINPMRVPDEKSTMQMVREIESASGIPLDTQNLTASDIEYIHGRLVSLDQNLVDYRSDGSMASVPFGQAFTQVPRSEGLQKRIDALIEAGVPAAELADMDGSQIRQRYSEVVGKFAPQENVPLDTTPAPAEGIAAEVVTGESATPTPAPATAEPAAPPTSALGANSRAATQDEIDYVESIGMDPANMTDQDIIGVAGSRGADEPEPQMVVDTDMPEPDDLPAGVELNEPEAPEVAAVEPKTEDIETSPLDNVNPTSARMAYRIDALEEAGIDTSGMSDQEIRRIYQEALLEGKANAAQPAPTPAVEDLADDDILPDIPDAVAPTSQRVAARIDALEEAGIDTSSMDNAEINRIYQEALLEGKANAAQPAPTPAVDDIADDDILPNIPDDVAPTSQRTAERIDLLEASGIDTSGMSPNEVRDVYNMMSMMMDDDTVSPADFMDYVEDYQTRPARVQNRMYTLMENGVDTKHMDDAEINRTYQEMLLAAKEKQGADIDDADILPEVVDEGATSERLAAKIDALEAAGVDTSGMSPNDIRIEYTKRVMEGNASAAKRKQPFRQTSQKQSTGTNNPQPKQQANTNATGKQANPTQNNSTPSATPRTFSQGVMDWVKKHPVLTGSTGLGLGYMAWNGWNQPRDEDPQDFPERALIPIPEDISDEGFDGEAPAPGRAVGPDPALIQRIQQQQRVPRVMGGTTNARGNRYFRRHT